MFCRIFTLIDLECKFCTLSHCSNEENQHLKNLNGIRILVQIAKI